MGQQQSGITGAPGQVAGGVATGLTAPATANNPFAQRDDDNKGLPGMGGPTPGFAAAQAQLSELTSGQAGLAGTQRSILAGQAAAQSTLNAGFTGLSQGQAGLLAGQAGLLAGQAQTQQLLSQSTAALSQGISGLSGLTSAGFQGTQGLITSATLGTRELVSGTGALLGSGQRTLAMGQAGLSQATDQLSSDVGGLRTLLIGGAIAAGAAFIYTQQGDEEA